MAPVRGSIGTMLLPLAPALLGIDAYTSWRVGSNIRSFVTSGSCRTRMLGGAAVVVGVGVGWMPDWPPMSMNPIMPAVVRNASPFDPQRTSRLGASAPRRHLHDLFIRERKNRLVYQAELVASEALTQIRLHFQ